MSDIYIPELIELGSYWQKAVEDAIYDTLKGENRLYYALKNRKKINEKLEKLGLKSPCSQSSFSRLCDHSRLSDASHSENNNTAINKSASNAELNSYQGNSATSIESVKNEDASSHEVQEPDRASFSSVGSKSKSKEGKSTPPEKIYRNPERPILGNGSLEKMKKSQNSFYCEPMGTELRVEDCDKEAVLYGKDEKDSDNVDKREKNKKIEWLHFREDKAFDDSDTEMSFNECSDQKFKKDSLLTLTAQGHTLDDVEKNYDEESQSFNTGTVENETQQIPMRLDPGEDLFWEKEVKNAIRENAGQERKLYFALAKREIVNENLRRSNVKRCSYDIKIKKSEAKMAEKKRQNKKFLSSFVKFYLEVYRELCHKYCVKDIAAEAAARWRQKSLK